MEPNDFRSRIKEQVQTVVILNVCECFIRSLIAISRTPSTGTLSTPVSR